MEDRELKALLDEKFSEVKTDIRHARVEIEALRGEVKLNNELIHGVDEKIERFRGETADNFKTVRSAIGLSNKVLIKRIAKLEKAS